MRILSFFRSNKVIQGQNQFKKESIDLSNIKFVSSRHSKYEKGVKTSSIDNCWRGIEIYKNSKNENSYSMIIFTVDPQKDGWSDTAQMAIKQLRLKNVSDNKFELNGYGDDGMGVSFSDYGITVIMENNVIAKVILKFFYRNTELHYCR